MVYSSVGTTAYHRFGGPRTPADALPSAWLVALACRRRRYSRVLICLEFILKVKAEFAERGGGEPPREPALLILDSSSLRGAATVVRQRRNVDNFGYFDTCAVDGADC